jgi:hypothetical protein
MLESISEKNSELHISEKNGAPRTEDYLPVLFSQKKNFYSFFLTKRHLTTVTNEGESR